MRRHPMKTTLASAAGIAGLAALTACANGTHPGSQIGRSAVPTTTTTATSTASAGSSSPAQPGTTAASPSASDTTTAPGAPQSTASPVAPVNSTTSAPPSGATHPAPSAPSAAPAPPQCPGGTCTELSHSSSKNGLRIVLRKGTGSSGVVELVKDSVPIAWDVRRELDDGTMNCTTRTPDLHCVVQGGVGAHSSAAQLYLARATGFTKSALIGTDTPGIVARDLDNDGDLDLAVPVNDYTPDYADGGQYWQTYLLHQGQYRSSGCTPDKHGRLDPAPTKPVFGSCPTAR